MSSMNCAQLKDAAPELVLGILPGDERAAAIGHLDDCPSCQQEVSSLTSVTDQLLSVAPTAEPSAGFEQRVVTALSSGSPAPALRSRVRRRVTLAGLALAACLALGALVWHGGRSAPPSLAVAEMRTGAGDVVGQVFVHRQQPAVLFMSLPEWADRVEAYGQPEDTYSVRVERGDGPAELLPITVSRESSWAATLDFDPDTITSVAIVDSQGRVWCSTDLGMAV